MAILFLVVSLVGIIACLIVRIKRDDQIRMKLEKEYDKYEYVSYSEFDVELKREKDKYLALFNKLLKIFTKLFVFSLIAVCVLSFSVFTGSTIDNKISMYEEENVKIEASISTAVQGYMDFESETFTNLKDEDAMSLVTLYPELKSDTLVQEQMQVYLDNNAKIKKLKEEKINLSKFKWLLYFGS